MNTRGHEFVNSDFYREVVDQCVCHKFFKYMHYIPQHTTAYPLESKLVVLQEWYKKRKKKKQRFLRFRVQRLLITGNTQTLSSEAIQHTK